MPRYAAEVLIDLNVELSDDNLSDTSDDVNASLYEMGNIQSCLDVKIRRDVVVSRGIQCGRSRIHRHRRSVPLFSSSDFASNDSSSSSSSSHNTALWRQSRQRNRNCNAYSLSNEHHQPRRHHISYQREEKLLNPEIPKERVKPRPRYSLNYYPKRRPAGPSHSQLREMLRQPHMCDTEFCISNRQTIAPQKSNHHVNGFREINEHVAPRASCRYVGPDGDSWRNPPHSLMSASLEKPPSWSEEPETELLPDLSLKEEVDPVTSDSTIIQTNLDERRKLFHKFTGAQAGNTDVAPSISFIGDRRPKPIIEERECSNSAAMNAAIVKQSHEDISFRPFSSKAVANDACEALEPEPSVLEEAPQSHFVLFTRGSEETRKGARSGGSHSLTAPVAEKKIFERRVVAHPVRPLPKPPRPAISRAQPRRPPWNCGRSVVQRRRDISVHPSEAAFSEEPTQHEEVVPVRGRVRLLTSGPRRPRKAQREEDLESKDHDSLAPTESDCLVQHRFFLPESAAVEQIVADPSDRRIKAICDRLRCDIDIYPRMPRAGFFKNMLVIGAPNTSSLRKCVRSLDQSMNWCLSSQLKQL